MGFFNIPLEKQKNRLDKLKYVFSTTHEYLKDSPILSYNSGYFPPYSFIKNEDIHFKNEISLHLFLLENIDITNKKILDIGCGRGGGIYSYQKYLGAEDVYGIDYVEECIDYCKKHYRGNFSVMDLNDIKYENDFFDIITSVDTVSFTTNNFEKFANKIFNILKTNGIFITADFQISQEKIKILKSIFGNIEQINISENMKNSCIDIIYNIDNLPVTQKHKDFYLYQAKENYEEIVNRGNKVFKYTFYKDRS